MEVVVGLFLFIWMLVIDFRFNKSSKLLKQQLDEIQAIKKMLTKQ